LLPLSFHYALNTRLHFAMGFRKSNSGYLFTFDSKILNPMMPAGYTAGFGLSTAFFKVAAAAIGLILNLIVLFYVVSKKWVLKINPIPNPDCRRRVESKPD
jgi:hypothetical protein